MSDGSVNDSMPTKDELHNPVLWALKDAGGSATNEEVVAHIVEKFGLPNEVVAEELPSGHSRLWNRLSWARNELKHTGYVEMTTKGVWTLTALGQSVDSVDPNAVRREAVRIVKSQHRGKETSTNVDVAEPESGDALLDEEENWRNELASVLHEMAPSAFENLCGVILRESGFTEVRVTGKSGDGGIDGNGLLRIQGLISVPISFQCKRYKGSVGSPLVREFRGSLGRQAERGLLMTTGTFTLDARKEAMREGAVFIDLMDGDALLDKLKDLKLGVKVEMVEQTSVDAGWWESNYDVSF